MGATYRFVYTKFGIVSGFYTRNISEQLLLHYTVLSVTSASPCCVHLEIQKICSRWSFISLPTRHNPKSSRANYKVHQFDMSVRKAAMTKTSRAATSI